MTRHSLILSTTALALATGAVAQETETRLEPIEVTGLRPVDSGDVTGSVTVLEGPLLDVRAAPYIADELRAVPGVAVSRSGALGGLTQVRVRGAEANHTLVLIDRIEVSDPTTGETDFGLFAGLQPQRVEVLRGEQSGLYGSDAIGGVINIVTGYRPGLVAAAEAGSRDTYRGSASYGLGSEAGFLNLSINGFSSSGVDTSGSGGETDGSEAYGALLNGGSRVAGWELRGLLRYSKTAVDLDSDSDFDGLLDDIDASSEAEQWTLGGQAQTTAFDVDHLILASFNSVQRDNFSAASLANSADGERTKLAYSPSVTLALSGNELVLTGLIDYEIEDYTARDTELGGATNQDRSFETLGFAAEARAQIGFVQLAASLRHDDNDGQFEDATTGRLSAAVAVTPDQRLRASFGTGVKNPTFTELFGFFPGSFVGNPALKPEQSQGWEIGWDGNFGPLDVSATYFEAELTDEIFTAFNADFTSTPQNRVGKSNRSGVELAGRLALSEEFSLTAQATQTDSTADDGSEEVRVPELTASLSMAYAPPTWNGGRVGVALDYVGEQDDFDFGSVPARRVTLDAYTLLSASAEIPLGDRLRLTLRGENLLDETTTDVFGYNAPGAGVFIGLKVVG